jgi:hypothetical protein
MFSSSPKKSVPYSVSYVVAKQSGFTVRKEAGAALNGHVRWPHVIQSRGRGVKCGIPLTGETLLACLYQKQGGTVAPNEFLARLLPNFLKLWYIWDWIYFVSSLVIFTGFHCWLSFQS